VDNRLPEPELDVTNLYREDLFSDLKVGGIRRLTPVTADGHVDETRPVIYVGQASLLTPMGTLPLSFEIEAKTLAEAVAGYKEAAKEGIERTIRELQELRREQASSLIVPGAGGGMSPQPGLIDPGGGMRRR